MEKTRIDKLLEPFELLQREGPGGRMYDYVPSDSIILRMIEAFDNNWGTEVISAEILEDHVLVQVRVSAFDEGRTYSHDGFGSVQVARFTGGKNAGKIIDLGNLYKAAEAKAIRHACSRFGAGLKAVRSTKVAPSGYTSYNDSISHATEKPAAEVSIPVGQAAPATKKETTITEPMPSIPPVSLADVVPPAPAAPAPAAPAPAAAPEIPEAFNTEVTTPSIPSPTNNGGGLASRLAGVGNGGKKTKITDIQKTAIEGTIALCQITDVAKYIKEGLEKAGLDTTNAPSSLEDLSYEQAVALIRNGNDKQL